MTPYSIDDMHGSEICSGLQTLGLAQEVAQKHANRRGESVWIYGADIGGDDDGIEVRPERISADEDTDTVEYIYTTVGEYQTSHPKCTGDFVGQDGEILASDARITVSSRAGEWCPGEYDGNQTWEPLA